jgi:uncharacterized protein
MRMLESDHQAMADIESPCTRICVVDPQAGLCIGCGRSLAEIGGWLTFSVGERARIMSELPQRLALLRGGVSIDGM